MDQAAEMLSLRELLAYGKVLILIMKTIKLILIVIPIDLQQLKSFMEEDQQDSGGEYDLHEGFDRFSYFPPSSYLIY